MDWYESLGIAVILVIAIGGWAWSREDGWKDGLK